MNILQDSLRYRFVRSLSPKDFTDLVFKVVYDHPIKSDYEDVFDALVDEKMKQQATPRS